MLPLMQMVTKMVTQNTAPAAPARPSPPALPRRAAGRATSRALLATGLTLAWLTGPGCSGDAGQGATDVALDAAGGGDGGWGDAGGDGGTAGLDASADPGHVEVGAGQNTPDGMGDGASPDVGGPDAGGPDPTEAVFPTDGVLEVTIQLAPEDWDALRAQNRNLAEVLGSGCLDGPTPSPFTWFHASVTVGGTVPSVSLDDVAVRKKGFLGSLDFARPSLKLKFDKYVAGQEVAGMERLTLNNDKQDPSKIAQCLTYGLFRAAGVPAPRCGFAHVTVNGQDLGVYTSVEPVKKAFLRQHFADAGGNLYEGTLSDFREGWTATFDKKTNESQPGHPDLDAAAAALDASFQQPDDQALAALEPFFDVNRFLTFWAVEAMTTHQDGYTSNTNNFFVYADPSPGGQGRFVFMPWGADATFLSSPPDAPPEQDPGRAVYLTSALARRLWAIPSMRQAYVARLTELMITVWDPAALGAQVDAWEALLKPFVLPDNQAAFLDSLTGKREVISGRRARIGAEIAAGLPAEAPPPRPAPCLQDKGTVDATFDTTWGTVDIDNLFTTGTGTMTATLTDAALNGTFTPLVVGAKVGISDAPDSQGRATLVVAGRFPDTSLLVLWLETDPSLLPTVSPGGPEAAATLSVDWTTTSAQVLYLPPGGTQPVLVGLVIPGTVTLTEASQVDGAPFRGSVSGSLLSW